MIRGAIVEPTMKPTADGRDQRRVERRQAEDQLQVLRDEEEVADDDEDAQEVRAQRCAERADSKRRTSMIGDSRRSWRRTNRKPSTSPATITRTGGAERPSCASVLARTRRRGWRERQRHADEVQRARVRVPVLGQGARSEDEQEAHDRYADEEHRPPPEELEEHAAENGPMAPPAE